MSSFAFFLTLTALFLKNMMTKNSRRASRVKLKLFTRPTSNACKT